MIFGLNVLEFVTVTWLGSVAVIWICGVSPEICKELNKKWRKKHPKKTKQNPERTVKPPVWSYNPDTIVALPRTRKYEIQVVFVMNRLPVSRGRHARI